MNVSAFIIMILLLSIGCNLVLASPVDRFNPDQKGNLIGVVILSAVSFCLICLLAIHQFRRHHVGIKAWFRLRNPSVRALAPDSVLFDYHQDGGRPLELDDLSNDDRHSISLRDFLIGAASDGTENPEVRPRPSLIGLGIMTGRSDEPIITPPPRAVLPGGRVSYGVGWDEATARFGPPPTPPPNAPLPPPPPARDARRRFPYIPAAEEDEEGGRFAASRSFSAGL